MRRMLPILALVVALAAALVPGPASGHAVVTPNQIDVGQPVTINFQVVADLPRPMIEIRFETPPEFAVTGVGRVPGWEVSRSGSTITLTGNAVPGTFVVVPISGRATARTQLRFPLIEVADDGSTLEFREDGFGGQSAPVVYAGLEFDDGGAADSEENGGTAGPLVAGVVVFVALAGAAVWWARRPRTG